jgi:hypothetical protein
MTLRLVFAAAMTALLASCTTTASLSGDALSARWVGREAGKFFAAYGPPQSDENSGSTSTYIWKGGYKTVRSPAQYKGEGKNRKLVARAGARYLSCSVRLTVSDSYTIKSITKISDRPGSEGGASWCEEVLDAAPKKS